MQMAEDALIDAWVRNNYVSGTGPINVYPCDDCGNFHFTSKGAMNLKLKELLDKGTIQKNRTAYNYESKFRGRR